MKRERETWGREKPQDDGAGDEEKRDEVDGGLGGSEADPLLLGEVGFGVVGGKKKLLLLLLLFGIC